MTNRIEITPEMVKLAQQRIRATGGDVRQEIARHIAQEAVLSLDPEHGFLLDEDAAFSRDDRLVAAFDLNDIVVNGLRLDVRLVAEDGRVSLPRFLTSQWYMTTGTLCVAINSDRTASVVSFIEKSDWELQDKNLQSEDRLVLRANRSSLDLIAILSRSASPVQAHEPQAAASASELSKFVANRSELSLERQRKIVDATLSNPNCWSELSSIIASWSKPVVRKTLTHAAVWNYKLERLVETVQPKFPKLTREEVKLIIARTGENTGGQSESPQFRKELLTRLTREELSRNLQGEQLRKAHAIADQVMSGRSMREAVSDFVKNNHAVDLALTIKRQRQKFVNFIEATSEELSVAFRQLSVQPVYATHSQQEGVETINEALKLLDACELAERAKELERDLATV